MDKIIIIANPVRFGKITVCKDGNVKEVVTAMPKDLAGVALNLAKSYNISCIDIAGPKNFTEHIGKQLNDNSKTMFKKKIPLSIEYIKGV